MEVIKVRANLLTECDIVGLPGDDFYLPSWLKKGCDLPCKIEFENYSYATSQVQEILERMVAKHGLLLFSGHKVSFHPETTFSFLDDTIIVVDGHKIEIEIVIGDNDKESEYLIQGDFLEMFPKKFESCFANCQVAEKIYQNVKEHVFGITDYSDYSTVLFGFEDFSEAKRFLWRLKDYLVDKSA